MSRSSPYITLKEGVGAAVILLGMMAGFGVWVLNRAEAATDAVAVVNTTFQESIEKKLDAMEEKMDKRFDKHDGKLDELERYLRRRWRPESEVRSAGGNPP
jgi:hypothetical protein